MLARKLQVGDVVFVWASHGLKLRTAEIWMPN